MRAAAPKASGFPESAASEKWVTAIMAPTTVNPVSTATIDLLRRADSVLGLCRTWFTKCHFLSNTIRGRRFPAVSGVAGSGRRR